jgi:hypothetical protein
MLADVVVEAERDTALPNEGSAAVGVEGHEERVGAGAGGEPARERRQVQLMRRTV